MKKFYHGLIATVAIGAAATSLLATVIPSSRGILKAESVMPTENTPREVTPSRRIMANAADDASTYWTTATSYYNENGYVDLSDGMIRNYGTKIKIDGEKATLYGLMYLPTGEIEEEYAMEGVYNDITNTITIKTAEYNLDNDVDDYTPVADIYMAGSDSYVNLVLIVGNMDEYNQIHTETDLVLKVSDDFKTVTSRTGFGAYVFSEEGEGLGIYDFYRPGVTMTLSAADTPLSVSTDRLDFDGLFICENLPVKQTFLISNPSSEDVSFKIESSSADLTTSVTEGSLAACSQRAVEVTLLPSAPGIFSGSLTISSSNSDMPHTVSVNVEVWEQPDYTKITNAGSEKIDFQMSPLYPFVISEFDNHIAAMSTNNGKGDNTQSWFACNVEVPAGKTGIFSWDAAQIARQPNSLVITLDEERIKYNYESQSDEPENMSGVIALPSGKHEIAFVTEISMDWEIYGTPTTGYVWGLDYQLVDSKPNAALLIDRTADFGTIYFDKLSVDSSSSVTLLNTGDEPLKVTGISDNGNFHGKIPSVSVPKGGEIEVPLTWTAKAVGEDKADIIISTTAGDFTVTCVGIAEAIPYDYSSIVKEGEISFTTDMKYPFVPSANGKYFYNSTSKNDAVNGITYSWIDATFEIPEGQVGILSWEAVNDSQDIFWFMGTPSTVSGTIVTIDGDNQVDVGGVGIPCGSKDIYSPNQTTFRSGRHNVRFNYKKTSNDENYVFGDDRLMLSAMALEIVSAESHQSDISTTEVEYPKGIFVGCAGHFPVSVYNYTDKKPELLSFEADGPFSAKVADTANDNLNLIIEFNPTEGKEYNGGIVIRTNIGEYSLSCKGNGRESKLGEVIFYESFEYDFNDSWIISDLNGDGNEWTKLSPYAAAFKNFNLKPFEGNESLLIMGYDPSTFTYYETDDVAATPEIAIPEDGKTTLQFQLNVYSYQTQQLEVLAGEGNDPSMYSVVETVTLERTDDWEVRTMDLSEFSGKTIRIAFKAKDVSNYFAIDDVLVASTGTDGVDTVSNDPDVVAVEYYTPDGKRCERPLKGVCIEVRHHADGKTSTRKILTD